MGDDNSAAHALELLSHRIKNDLRRSTCSPSLLLLDECLKDEFTSVNHKGHNPTSRQSHILSVAFLNQTSLVQAHALSTAITRSPPQKNYSANLINSGLSKEKFVNEIT